MSKLDRLKAEISFHEKMFFTAIAMILGLLGWAANNYLTVSAVVLFLSMIGLIGVVGFGVWNYKRIKQFAGHDAGFIEGMPYLLLVYPLLCILPRYMEPVM